GGPRARAVGTGAPSLTRFGWREVARAIDLGWTFGVILAWAVLKHLLRHPTAVVRGWRRGPARTALGVAASEGVVEAFMAMGPTYVKLGQMIASSPGMFPTALADACLRTLHDVKPFPAETARE